MQKNILFYVGFTDAPWNISYSLSHALGGSERAVIYLSIHLSKLLGKEYTIYISGGNVGEEIIENIHYINLDNLPELIQKTHFETIIISRYIAFFEMFSNFNTKQVLLWAHDTEMLPWGCNLSCEQIIEKWNYRIDKCICLTEWHKNIFAQTYPIISDKLETINNGIQIDKIGKPMKKLVNRFIYTSRPERGLTRLLELWPDICKQWPDAELKIAGYTDFPSTDEEREQFRTITQHPNIEYLGKLTQNQLYELMNTAEYWLYTNCYDETSCITALEMLYNDVICVYYPNAGLVNTIGDYGVVTSYGNEILDIMNLSEENKTILRTNGHTYAMECSWENRAKKWTTFIT